jgi:hypothetical protein
VEACGRVARFLSEANDEANWEDEEAADDDEQNMLHRHGDQQSGLVILALPANALPPRAFVAN